MGLCALRRAGPARGHAPALPHGCRPLHLTAARPMAPVDDTVRRIALCHAVGGLRAGRWRSADVAIGGERGVVPRHLQPALLRHPLRRLADGAPHGAAGLGRSGGRWAIERADRSGRRRRGAMSWLGIAMFVAAIATMIATGLPVYAVLLGIAGAFAVIGMALGAFDWHLLTAMPSRIVGLLEHDLLQALPLYALIGALLNRLPLAQLLHAGGERLFGRSA